MKELEQLIQRFTASVEEQYSALDKVLEIEKTKLKNKKESK